MDTLNAFSLSYMKLTTSKWPKFSISQSHVSYVEIWLHLSLFTILTHLNITFPLMCVKNNASNR